jgi:hypothetical protein
MSNDLVQRLRSPANVFYEYAADNGAFLRESADHIEALERAICNYVSTVVSYEGVTFIDEQTEDWQKLIYSVCEARAALVDK